MTRIRTDRDAVPGGLAMAMCPVLTDWSMSSPDGDENPYYVLHNVNLSCNPVGGSTLLGSGNPS